MAADRRPIGYWVKELDRLLDASFAGALVADRLTRRHWQILNLLADHAADLPELTVALSPFVTDGPREIADTVDDLRDKGWLSGASTLLVTDVGRTAHQRIAQQVNRARHRVTEGITADEYALTVDVLERMAGNLAAASAQC